MIDVGGQHNINWHWWLLLWPLPLFLLYAVFQILSQLIGTIKDYREKEKQFKQIPGSNRFSWLFYLIGNADIVYHTMSHLTASKALYQTVGSVSSNETLRMDGIQSFYIGWSRFVAVYSASTLEPLLNSSSLNISKATNYSFLDRWLGMGLLTSTGDHWRRHRKFLTPAFHFRILDSFVPIMNECSREMCELIKVKQGASIDIRSYITNSTLDTICETAMNVRVGAQSGSHQYVDPLKRLMKLVMERMMYPMYQNELLYQLFPASRKLRKNLQIVHRFVSGVIEERRHEMEQSIQNSSMDLNSVLTESEELSLLGGKKRYAFMDTLLLQHFRSPESFTVQDIEDEVNTFMFEGHDTTAEGLTFALLLIGDDQRVQDKIYEELESIFGDEMSRSISTEDCRQMKYLEMCIKESLRLYPPVPVIGRNIEQDFQTQGYTVPAGCNCLIYIYSLHRDPEVFPKPERFIPERFEPDAPIHRQPYAYLPFSAGPRNCIGQKFAILEMKIVIALVLRKFRLKSITKRDQIDIEFSMIIKPNSPVMIKFIKRL